MRFINYSDTQEFQQRVESYLLEREVEHNLILGLCAQLISGNTIYEQPPYHCVIETDQGKVVGAALRTPPYNLILSHIEDRAALSLIVDACMAAGQELSGVLGKPEQVQDFAEVWHDRGGKKFQLKMRQMLHQLERVVPARSVKGGLRIATPEDAEMLEYWFVAFQSEAFGKKFGEWFTPIMRQAMKKRLAQKAAPHFIWWDGLRPVCWVSYRATTDRVVRVGPVYTPPSERGRGYASALVAAVSQISLDLGYRYCSLYTDLANPTANAIYRRIGYEPLCEIHQYECVDA